MHTIWKGYRGLYDIYVSTGCDRPPEMSDLIPLVPVLAHPDFQELFREQFPAPGVLRLALPEELAERLLERLMTAGGEGHCFPADYHWPRLSLEQAASIARQEIEKQRLEEHPTEVLGPFHLYIDGAAYWIFAAAVPRLVKQGYIPGAIMVFVDKLDGHLWTLEEVRSR